MGKYIDEHSGQIAFFENFRIDYANNEVLRDNTDGIWNGNLIEFKLDITDLNKVLLQAIKYLSRMRIKGESVPANILLVCLNSETVFLYHSEEYRNHIEQVYVGPASKGLAGFIAGSPSETIDYSTQEGTFRVLEILRQTNFMPVNLNEDCIVGWGERYYRENPGATKGDFLGDGTGKINISGEIREPRHFKGLILPYEKPTNERFKYLMDKLNDKIHKKKLGAFFTPPEYCAMAADLVRQAIKRVPPGNDYIILDRCAGTGNLEASLTDEELSHCVLSTYEYYEYKVLVERLGDKVKTIIPPTEANVVYEQGLVANADAMSRDYIENAVIREFVNNPSMTVILYENPPYRDQVADNKEKSKSKVNTNFVFEEFKKDLPYLPNSNISTARDILNQFVWSGWHYYMRQPTDSYVLFAPIKYWKTLGLCNKKCIKGYLFNRKFFHASPSGVACMLWANKEDQSEEIVIDCFDIDERTRVTSLVGTYHARKAHRTLEPFFDRRKREGDIETNVYCEASGIEANRTCDGKSYAGDDIIGYLRTDSFGIDPKHVSLTRCTLYNIRGYYLRTDRYLDLLPLFAAKLYPQTNWYEKDVYYSTSDGGVSYTSDVNLKKSCLIFTCLTPRNKCRSFMGSDMRYYRNELCLDGDTVAARDLAEFSLDDAEQELLDAWNRVLAAAKTTQKYDASLSYGVWQISDELNTFHEETTRGKPKKVPDYPELNGHLESLRVKVFEYYKSHIQSKLFKYELLK